jgi:5-methylthioadenosine/S-adenosylhomocysteine deaminase
MSLLIRNATVLAMGGPQGSTPFRGDILVEGDRIAGVGQNVPVPEAAQIVDGTDKLVIPGLVNAHVHSWEAMFKGRCDNMPLELWMLY